MSNAYGRLRPYDIVKLYQSIGVTLAKSEVEGAIQKLQSRLIKRLAKLPEDQKFVRSSTCDQMFGVASLECAA